ncbi:hypothetical protein CI592_10795, partial [Fischerella thermalis CCMEE 5328]
YYSKSITLFVVFKASQTIFDFRFAILDSLQATFAMQLGDLRLTVLVFLPTRAWGLNRKNNLKSKI